MGTRVPLQAILLADTFTTNFKPITLECPKVLLPLVNTPMIDYTLSWLESEHVEQVFVICCSHSKQIINHLENSNWVNQPKPNFSVTTIESPNCTSVGDALRLIHERDLIQDDFILVSGDTVTNMNLTKALQEHKKRKQNDAVMTMVIKQSKKPNNSQVVTDELFMAIDPTTKQLLYYEDDLKGTTVTLDKSFLTKNPTLHNNKQDCYIDICSPQVLNLFTENFDFQHLRGDFVKGLLVDELTGFKIFTHEIHPSCYASRIDNFKSYDSISKDIIQRWAYPFVPDVHISTNTNPTKLERHGVYRACNITQSCSSRIGPFTCIGKDTCIGDKTVISNSVVGDGCKIGCNVEIDGCYMWNNVTIQDGCKLRGAVLCDGVVMKSGAVLESGVVLSYKVVVGPGFVVPSCSKVSLIPQPNKELENGDSINDICGVVSDMGEDGCGFIWSMSEVDHEEEERIVCDVRESDTESDDDERDECEVFEKEVEAIFLRWVHEKVEYENIIRELQSLRVLNSSMDLEKFVGALFYSTMKLALDNYTSNNSGKKDLVKEMNDVISKWGKLLKKYLKGIDEEIEVIMKFEEMCLESMKEYAPLFENVLYVFYDKNIIKEEAILKWADEKEHADESDKVFVKQSQEFIQWLKEASEEEED